MGSGEFPSEVMACAGLEVGERAVSGTEKTLSVLRDGPRETMGAWTGVVSPFPRGFIFFFFWPCGILVP